MDVKREGVAEARQKKQRRLIAVAVVVFLGLAAWVMSLEPAAPSVDRTTVWTDTVKRGSMLRQVRGPGTLVPVEIRWIAARTEGRVERRRVLPGTVVKSDTIVIDMSSISAEATREFAASC